MLEYPGETFEEQASCLHVTLNQVKDEHSRSLSVSLSYSLHQPNSTPRVDESNKSRIKYDETPI